VSLARLIVSLLLARGEPVTVAVDDTLFRRCGRKVWAVSWSHDGSAPGPEKVGFGNNGVIAGIVVAARLVVKNTTSASRLWLARRMVEDLARAAWPNSPCRG
jgi:hypothetical protein